MATQLPWNDSQHDVQSLRHQCTKTPSKFSSDRYVCTITDKISVIAEVQDQIESEFGYLLHLPLGRVVDYTYLTFKRMLYLRMGTPFLRWGWGLVWHRILGMSDIRFVSCQPPRATIIPPYYSVNAARHRQTYQSGTRSQTAGRS